MPTAHVDFVGNFKPLLAQSRVAGTAAGGNVTAGFTAAFKKFAAPAAIAGIGTAAFKLGETFKTSYNTIRSETGATGATLRGLEKDFKVVAASRPTGFNVAAEAVAGLNKRLGLTGKPLQEMSTGILRLSGLTKTDVGDNIASVTRAFGDWEVATKDQAKTLDFFFRASQASGASVASLAGQVVQFGAPLRQVGFTLEESTAMFAQFEKAGVNTQTMMPGLRLALGAFLAQGRDPAKALRETFKGIETGAISTTEALKIFGKRSGADMIEAIQQGRFSLDELTASLANGSDTIAKAAADTSTFAGKLGVLKNKVLVGMEPIATGVYSAINNGMAAIVPIAGTAAGALGEVFSVLVNGDFTGAGPFTEDSPIIDGLFRVRELVGGVVTSVKDRLLPIWERVTGFLSDHASTAWWALAGAIGVVVGPLALGALWGALSAIGSVLVAVAGALATPVVLVAALAAGFVVAYREVEPFRVAVEGVASAIWDRLVGAFDWIKGTGVPAVLNAWGDLKAGFSGGGDDGIFGTIGSTARRVLGDVIGRVTDLRDDVLGAYDRIKSIDWGDAWGTVTSGAADLWAEVGSVDGLRNAIADIDWADVQTSVTEGLARVGDTALSDWAERTWNGMWDKIASFKVGDGIWAKVVENAAPIGEAFGNVDWAGVWEDIQGMARPMVDAFIDLKGSLTDVVNVLRPHVLPVMKALGIALGVAGFVMHKVFVFQVKALALAIKGIANVTLPVFIWAMEHVIVPVIERVAGYIQNVAIPWWGFLARAATTAFGWVADKASWLWGTVLQPVFGAISGYITNWLIPTYQTLWTVVSTVFTGIWSAISFVWGLVQPIFGAVVGFIRDHLITKFNELAFVAGLVWSGIQTVISTAWDNIRGKFDAIVGFVDETLVPIWDRISGAVGRAFDKIPDIIRGALRLAGNVVAGFLRGAAGVADAIGLRDIQLGLEVGAKRADAWGEHSAPSSGGGGGGAWHQQAEGGYIHPSWGTPGKDSVPAMLMPGEVVIRKSSVDRYGLGNLLALNEGRLPGFAAGGQVLVKAGRFLESQGARITEHPMWDRVDPVHVDGSYHYRNSSGTGGDAFDANYGAGTSAREMAFFDKMEPLVRGMGLRTIWRKPGHFNHMHVDIGGGGDGGAVGSVIGAVSGVVDRVTQGLRDIAGGALDRLPKAPVAGGLLGIPGGAANFLRQGIIDMIKGRAAEIDGSTAGSAGDGFAANRAIAKPIFTEKFGASEWRAAEILGNNESGWNHLAVNPSSGAYGIPQALPGIKMASHGADWRTNPRTQSLWMRDYIAGRYDTPSNALRMWNQRSPHWYGEGGLVEQQRSYSDYGLDSSWNLAKSMIDAKDAHSQRGPLVAGDLHVHEELEIDKFFQRASSYLALSTP